MNERRDANGVSRRQALKLGLLGTAGLALPASGPGLSRLWAEQDSSARATSSKAKSVIQIWMWGGPAHLDTFDPKPEAGSDYSGPLNKDIATNVDGVRIGAKLPLLAKHADKFSIIRSMTHGINGHETASYVTQTGRLPSRLRSPARRINPLAGAW